MNSGPVLSSAIYQLCVLEQVTQTLWPQFPFLYDGDNNFHSEGGSEDQRQTGVSLPDVLPFGLTWR